jgi:hypothetical protein
MGMRDDMGDFLSRPVRRRRSRTDRTRPKRDDAGHSGRVFVTVAVVVILVLWGSLFLAFRLWRSNYRERAEFGANVMAPAIDPLVAVVPPDVAPEAWRAAVADTHAMLLAVSGSNLLDRDQMAALGAKFGGRVASARPETALETLAEVWDEMEFQAGPVVTEHHARPKVLPARRPRASGETRS